ncbi:MAG: hypothetical protein VYE22_11050 [Myxococcota bacterium]|nr:hypothetical protein [Myxococcota bacterium]
MRASLAALAALALLTACDGGDAPADSGLTRPDAGPPDAPRVRMAWRVRCNDGVCPPEEPPVRSVDAEDGQDGFEVACDVTLEGDERRMNLTVRSPEGWGLEVRGAKMEPMGVRLVGSLCQIRIFEPDDVDLFTPCSSNPPTPERACQFQRLDISENEGFPSLTGELRCEAAPAERDATRLRDVTAPASSGFAELVFQGCDGL